VAALVGGRVAREKILDGVAATDVDVIGPAGELIAIGGPGKVLDLTGLGQELKVLKAVAEQRGVRTMAYFECGTPESVLRIARRWLGKENVFVFEP